MSDGRRAWLARMAVFAVLLLDVTSPAHASSPPLTYSYRPVCGPPLPGHVSCFVQTLTSSDGYAVHSVAPSGYGPATIQAVYSLPSATQGRGQVVAIVDAFDDPRAEADLAVYRSEYGLRPCTSTSGCFRKVDQSGGTDYPEPNVNWASEISADLDMVSAVCPLCSILLVEANSASQEDMGAAVDTAVRLGADVVSASYGCSESPEEVALDTHYNHPGVMIAVASGDDGYAGSARCPGTLYPAASPYVTAVGGTTLSQDAQGHWIERTWKGSGSGCSIYEPKPEWQDDHGCANRTVADTAAVAKDLSMYDTYKQPGWLVGAGTSFSAPIIAATYALAGQEQQLTGASYLYMHDSGLKDVTLGRNGTCGTYLCSAGVGYDGPTGKGSPQTASAFGQDYVWAASYDGPGQSDDHSQVISISPDGGRIYVSGPSLGQDGAGYATVAYVASTGRQIWLTRGGSRDSDAAPVAQAVSPDGRTLFVTGPAWPMGYRDFLTIAYDTATGSQLWRTRYDGPAHDSDSPAALAVSHDGRILFVVGVSTGLQAGHPTVDGLSLAYDANSGARLWMSRRRGGSLGSGSSFASVAVAPDDSSVYITGLDGRSRSAVTVAYNSLSGKRLWASDLGSGSGSKLAVRSDGAQVYLAAAAGSYLIAAYDSADGREIWRASYGNQHDDFPTGMALSPDDNRLFITGASIGLDWDYATVAFDTSDGSRLWAARYNHRFQDIATAMAVSPSGQTVLVTGYSWGNDDSSGEDYATVAYGAMEGDQEWVARFGALGQQDEAHGLVITPDGAMAIVTGWIDSTFSGFDFLTLAYRITEGEVR